MWVEYLYQVMQKGKNIWEKYIVLVDSFYLGLCNLQNHLCQLLVCLVQALGTWQSQLDCLGCVLACQSPGLQMLLQESVTVWLAWFLSRDSLALLLNYMQARGQPHSLWKLPKDLSVLISWHQYPTPTPQANIPGQLFRHLIWASNIVLRFIRS